MKKKMSGLEKALNSPIGKWCWFIHPETGEVVEGTYKRGRKVARIVKGVVPLREENKDGSVTYNFSEQTFTVPKRIAITFGNPPAEAKS